MDTQIKPARKNVILRKVLALPLGLSLTIGAIAGVGISIQEPASPASAASLSCGGAYIDNVAKNFVQSCTGSGNVKYTVKCLSGQPYIFTYKWKSGSSRLFNFDCKRTFTNGAVGVNWQLISG